MMELSTFSTLVNNSKLREVADISEGRIKLQSDLDKLGK